MDYLNLECGEYLVQRIQRTSGRCFFYGRSCAKEWARLWLWISILRMHALIMIYEI